MGARRTIAMILPGPFPTRQGTQVLVGHIARALAEAGHDVHLVTYGYGEFEDTFPFTVHRAQRVDVGFRSKQDRDDSHLALLRCHEERRAPILVLHVLGLMVHLSLLLRYNLHLLSYII